MHLIFFEKIQVVKILAQKRVKKWQFLWFFGIFRKKILSPSLSHFNEKSPKKHLKKPENFRSGPKKTCFWPFFGLASQGPQVALAGGLGIYAPDGFLEKSERGENSVQFWNFQFGPLKNGRTLKKVSLFDFFEYSKNEYW